MPVALPVSLEPAQDIDIVDGRMVARSAEPWLRIAPVQALTARGWIRIRYATNFFDDPVRPLLCFRLSGGGEGRQPMNGAVLGLAEWIGHVPKNSVEVLISPTNRPGPFEFRLQSVEAVSRLELVRRAMALNPAWGLMSVGARLIDSREEARQALKFASAFTPLQRYDAWYAAHSRPVDLAGIDAPRSDWRSGAKFRLLAALGAADAAALDTTLESLRAQVYRDWTLHLHFGGRAAAGAVELYQQRMASDSRLVRLTPGAKIAAHGNDGRAEWIGVVGIGDQLPSHALATFAEALVRVPRAALAYGDEDSIGVDGRRHSPRFKPDWSPYSYTASDYLGRLTLVRADKLSEADCETLLQFLREESELIASAASHLRRDEVCHARRLVYCRAGKPRQRPGASPGAAVLRDGAISSSWPTVSVIVPTRDRAKLLSACLRGLRQTTEYPSLDVVVVDNGTVEPAALALLKEIGSARGFRVLRHPGPFSYSALCNDGAAAARGDVLVFLNNDIAMKDRGWLQPLVRWAERKDVGAVGAKLLFPNGRIQHAGVVLGMGGLAAHAYHGLPADRPGYLERLLVPHEVAAVTGACLAVQRSKFEAVGGFDVNRLPVELNDVDLCLRLADRGWVSIWTPESVLYHRESASRGRQLRAWEFYRGERRYFARRWAHVIRDDPYFHPALSLFAPRAGLG